MNILDFLKEKKEALEIASLFKKVKDLGVESSIDSNKVTNLIDDISFIHYKDSNTKIIMQNNIVLFNSNENQTVLKNEKAFEEVKNKIKKINIEQERELYKDNVIVTAESIITKILKESEDFNHTQNKIVENLDVNGTTYTYINETHALQEAKEVFTDRSLGFKNEDGKFITVYKQRFHQIPEQNPVVVELNTEQVNKIDKEFEKHFNFTLKQDKESNPKKSRKIKFN